jgi:hypothetical protein
MDFCRLFPYLLSNLNEICYKRSSHHTVGNLRFSWNSAHGRLYFTCRFLCNNIYACAFGPNGILAETSWWSLWITSRNMLCNFQSIVLKLFTKQSYPRDKFSDFHFQGARFESRPREREIVISEVLWVYLLFQANTGKVPQSGHCRFVQ